jgi:hypothetical protein
VEKYEEEFRPFLPEFLQEVWKMLISLKPASKFDSVSERDRKRERERKR